MGYFPVDELTCQYLLATGRPKAKVDAVRAYSSASRCSGSRRRASAITPQVLELDFASVKPSVCRPKRPQDRIELPKLRRCRQDPPGPLVGRIRQDEGGGGKRYHQIVQPSSPSRTWLAA